MKLAIFSTLFFTGLAVVAVSQADAAQASAYDRDLALWNSNPIVLTSASTAIVQDGTAYARDLAVWTGARPADSTAIAQKYDANHARDLAAQTLDRPAVSTVSANSAYARDLTVWNSTPRLVSGVTVNQEASAYERGIALWHSYGVKPANATSQHYGTDMALAATDSRLN